MTGDDALAEALKDDYRRAPLDARTRALLDYTVQVTRDAHAVEDADVDRLREHGWTDDQILVATHIIGFFNYYARLVDALGVEPEDFMIRRPPRDDTG